MKRIISSQKNEPAIVEDHWFLLRDPRAETRADAQSATIFPFSLWRELRQAGVRLDPARTAIWLSADDDFRDEIDAISKLPLVAIDFPDFRDGRGYSLAYLLRTRYGFKGDLRAIGDVLRDQLFYMLRCGFTSFDVREDKDIADALKGLQTGFAVRYQGAADDPVPLFRKRQEAGHSGRCE
ncbi:DUF934 domain-containing protein [Rhodocyclus tenuis]|uniref:DUF934 domain-containing protein n=1 Tax=Rhodocyclus tenuis TaxID=1066 RepID=UPI0019067EFF|nr:DUF934 domain-containing protein [Rhodocyclus tenuis]MBK1680962.1 hypothetical protein [Rhodocyclus tenuis]